MRYAHSGWTRDGNDYVFIDEYGTVASRITPEDIAENYLNEGDMSQNLRDFPLGELLDI